MRHFDARCFDVRLSVVTRSGKRIDLRLPAVASVPGVDIFATARQLAVETVRQRRKGQIARFLPRAVAVPA